MNKAKIFEANVTSEELKDMFYELEVGESITVPVDRELSNVVGLYHYRKVAYENLMNSYIEGVTERAASFNLDKFIDQFIQISVAYDEAFKETAVKAIGTENYLYLSQRQATYKLELDWTVNKLKISRRDESQCDCSSCQAKRGTLD